MTDSEIKSSGYQLLLTDSEKLNYMNSALGKCKDDQFFSAIQQSAPLKTLKDLVKFLQHQDRTVYGTARRRKYRDSQDETGGSTGAAANKTTVTFPKGSCKNHPESTTHNTAGCRLTKSKSSASTKPKKHCTYCAGKDAHKHVQNTHNTHECTRGGSSSASRQKLDVQTIIKNRNLLHQLASSAAFSDALSNLTKRKREEDDADNEEHDD